jgi:hypothetical protein
MADLSFLPWLIGAIIIGGAITAAMNAAKGGEMARKFAALGTLAGKHKEEIIDAVGPPTSISAVGDGLTLLQWQTEGYHIALRFNGDVCEGVTHEFLHQG